MNATIPLTRIAELIGDSARSNMLIALLAGRALTAGELAMVAGISAQNASGHLRKLQNGRLVSIEVQGRHRYYRLATQDIANALEALAVVSASGSFLRREGPELSNIRFCRTCYDHLAGKVAVEITQSLLNKKIVCERGRDFVVTIVGQTFFRTLGIEVETLQTQRRAFARCCLDWTERRPHLSGGLGAALLRRCNELKWVAPIPRSRAMRLTMEGRARIAEHFGFSGKCD